MMPRPEHRIRLRAGWDCHHRESDDESAPEVVRRVDLPSGPPGQLPDRCRLTRQFGRPPVDPEAEEVLLELRDVPGLKDARLNGRSILPEGPGGRDWSIVLPGPLLPRNGLVLEVEREPGAGEETAPWGDVALVIRPRPVWPPGEASG